MNYLEFFEEFENQFKAIQPYLEVNIPEPQGSTELFGKIFNCLDLTSLNATDNAHNIRVLCEKVKDFQKRYPDLPNVAAVCVFPVFASVSTAILKNADVKTAVVSAGFPASQTFLETKIDETKRAIFFGIDEIDIVMSIGEFLDGNYEFVANEISAIKSLIGDRHLKVIIEVGALKNDYDIWKASLLAMEAGADFIKTSTGKIEAAASPETAWIMTHAIKAFHSKREKMIGFKAAGGISQPEEALKYWLITDFVLGEEWMNNKYFRIGASRLANLMIANLIGDNKEAKLFKYF